MDAIGYVRNIFYTLPIGGALSVTFDIQPDDEPATPPSVSGIQAAPAFFPIVQLAASLTAVVTVTYDNSSGANIVTVFKLDAIA